MSARDHLIATCGVGQQIEHGAAELRCRLNSHCSPAFQKILRNVRGVEVVRTDDDRPMQRRGLEQIMPADGHETAADECDVRGGVEAQQLAERIDE